MSRYQSRRHQRIMDESEHALHAAAESPRENDARIARQVVGDSKIYRLWEARHAQSILPVAKHSNGVRQILELRVLETQLVHRRALFEYVRDNQTRGKERQRLFTLFYGPRDFQNAVLAEHRQYVLAISSTVSADHLIDLMHEPISQILLKKYKETFKRYFALSCYMSQSENEIYREAVSPIYDGVSQQLMRLRKRLQTERPRHRCVEIEHQAMLAQSGRYPISNYMVG